MINIVILILLFSFKSFSYSISEYKNQWGYDSISCDLSVMSRVTIKNGRIKSSSKKEKAKMKTIFAQLNTKEPKMVYPDQITLIKIKQEGNTYWLLNPLGTFANTVFILNTQDKWFVQQRSSAFPGTMGAMFYSWAGKCE